MKRKMNYAEKAAEVARKAVKAAEKGVEANASPEF